MLGTIPVRTLILDLFQQIQYPGIPEILPIDDPVLGNRIDQFHHKGNIHFPDSSVNRQHKQPQLHWDDQRRAAWRQETVVLGNTNQEARYSAIHPRVVLPAQGVPGLQANGYWRSP